MYVCIIYVYVRQRYKALLCVYDVVIKSYLKLRKGQQKKKGPADLMDADKVFKLVDVHG